MANAPDRDTRNRRRGLVAALALHAAVVAVFAYPFLLGAAEEPVAYETVIELDFRDAATAAAAQPRSRTPTRRPVTEKAAAPKAEAPPAPPRQPAPPVLTAPEPAPPAPEAPETPVTEPAPAPAPPPASSPVDGTLADGADDESTGAPDVGDGDTVADAGAGDNSIGSALEGDGTLARAVVFRPRLDEVVRQNGSVVLNICINPRGRVIGVKWNEARSTITDTDIVREAIDKAKAYRFKADRSAPARECGALSIHINGL